MISSLSIVILVNFFLSFRLGQTFQFCWFFFFLKGISFWVNWCSISIFSYFINFYSNFNHFLFKLILILVYSSVFLFVRWKLRYRFEIFLLLWYRHWKLNFLLSFALPASYKIWYYTLIKNVQFFSHFFHTSFFDLLVFRTLFFNFLVFGGLSDFFLLSFHFIIEHILYNFHLFKFTKSYVIA